MKILLIHPQNIVHRRTTGIYGRFARYAPITMPTLAALVPPELKATVTVVDEMVEALDPDTPADLVGITCITGTASRAYELADHFRARGTPVVMGGIHVTLIPGEAARHADAIVLGYAEKTWPQLLRDFAAGRLQPVYRADTGPCEFVRPLRRHIRRARYGAPNTVEVIRGCRNQCEFCVSRVLTPNPQPRPLDDVIDEIRRLPGKTLSFLDPNLLGDIPFAGRLFERLTPLNRWWFGCATTEVTTHPGLLTLMARSGCKGLLIGFDSLSQTALDGIGKTFNRVDSFAETIRRIHDHGILITGCFIVGFDSDDTSVFDRTIEFANRTGIDVVHHTLFTPYPGTPAFERLNGEGRILTTDWSRYDGRHVVFRPALMTAAQLEAGFSRLWDETYSVSAIARRLLGRPALMKALAGFTNLHVRRFRQKAARVFP